MPQRPDAVEYTAFHGTYVALVPEGDILSVLHEQVNVVELLVSGITPEQESFRYAAGKWSVRQVFGHLADAERIFGYRVLCIARGQTEALPPFDENLFVETADFDARTLGDLATEWRLLREANLAMMKRLKDAAWARICATSGAPVSARAFAWIMAGHLRHHLMVLKERYRLG
jgi:hypothetical protein